eukprot:COSAG01_NODE_40291_length_465_cov_2.030055_1_plen_115_part_01
MITAMKKAYTMHPSKTPPITNAVDVQHLGHVTVGHVIVGQHLRMDTVERNALTDLRTVWFPLCIDRRLIARRRCVVVVLQQHLLLLLSCPLLSCCACCCALLTPEMYAWTVRLAG